MAGQGLVGWRLVGWLLGLVATDKARMAISMSKITVIKSTSSIINNYSQLFKFDIKI